MPSLSPLRRPPPHLSTQVLPGSSAMLPVREWLCDSQLSPCPRVSGGRSTKGENSTCSLPPAWLTSKNLARRMRTSLGRPLLPGSQSCCILVTTVTCRPRERKFPVIQRLQKKPKARLGLQFPVPHLMWETCTRDLDCGFTVYGQSAVQELL